MGSLLRETQPAPWDRLLNIACAEADLPWVEGYLARALGLQPGQYLTPQSFEIDRPVITEMDRAIESSRYTLLVISPASRADRWASYLEQLASFASLDEVRLICLLLTQDPLPLRLRSRVSLDCSDAARWEAEIARLREFLALPPPPDLPVACPYLGISAFAAADAPLFYGREEEVADMVARVGLQRRLLVIGPSGSGKSSLINAGLLPGLERTSLYARGHFLIRRLRPGAQPLAALRGGLGDEDGSSVPRLLAEAGAGRMLLVIDQMEEVFTLTGRDEQRRFLERVDRLKAVDCLTVLMAMRADFFPDLMNSPLWPVDPGERVELPPLRGEALRRAIRLPAKTVGVHLEDGLVERLLADASHEPGVLPLLQATLQLLWARREQRFLSLHAYEALGRGERSGLSVAVARIADAAMADLPPPRQAVARRILIRLVQFGEGRANTRQQRPVSALQADGDAPGDFAAVLRHLTERRLLTLGGEDEPETEPVTALAG